MSCIDSNTSLLYVHWPLVVDLASPVPVLLSLVVGNLFNNRLCGEPRIRIDEVLPIHDEFCSIYRGVLSRVRRLIRTERVFRPVLDGLHTHRDDLRGNRLQNRRVDVRIVESA